MGVGRGLLEAESFRSTRDEGGRGEDNQVIKCLQLAIVTYKHNANLYGRRQALRKMDIRVDTDRIKVAGIYESIYLIHRW